MGSFGVKVFIMAVPDDSGGLKKYKPDILAGIWIDKNKKVFSASTPLFVMTNKAMPGIMEIKNGKYKRSKLAYQQEKYEKTSGTICVVVDKHGYRKMWLRTCK
jgi:hypothetical protein